MQEDKRNKTSNAMSDDGKFSKIDKVPDKIEFHGIIGCLNRQMTLNTFGIQSESEIMSKIKIETSN